MKTKGLRGGFFSLLVVGILVSLTGISYSANIDEINRTIQSKGLQWFAKETPLSHLTAEEMKGWTGAMESSPPYTNLPENQSLGLPGGLASSFDWTKNNGKNYVTSVKDQGGCGGCWAFATTGALEAKTLIGLNLNVDLAEQIVISCTDSMTPATDSKPNNCTSGGYMETAADFIKNTGINLETFYPFTQANGSCGNASSGWQTDPYKIDSWSLAYAWNSPDINTLKNAVQTNGPVVVWMKVYSDFQSYGGGTYHYTSGNYAGNHFVLVVGWDDSKNAFHVKNSWGTSWGESGFFWMAYSEFGNNSTTQFARGAMYFGNAVHTNPQPPTPQCDLAVGFDVTISGKVIEDGYYSSNFTTGIMYFDICTSAAGETTDYFEGYLYDDSNDYWSVAGTIIWNHSFTSGYIQGANLDATAPYYNGTIKYSRGKYSLSGIGGNSDGESFIEIYSSVKGSGYELAADKGGAGAALKARRNGIQHSGKTKSNRVSK
jgi:C1A family cysteine protease